MNDRAMPVDKRRATVSLTYRAVAAVTFCTAYAGILFVVIGGSRG